MRCSQVVTLHGDLLDVRGTRGFTWTTSMRREDTGDGTCEIMSIESIDRLKRRGRDVHALGSCQSTDQGGVQNTGPSTIHPLATISLMTVMLTV